MQHHQLTRFVQTQLDEDFSWDWIPKHLIAILMILALCVLIILGATEASTGLTVPARTAG